MPAYYNEIDAKKAAWLRELIARNLIAPGDVDERSIADVRAHDLRRYRQCHFFAGIGIWSYALRLAGWPDDREVWTGSCPCQPFSAAGKGEAFDDERHLWPEFFRLIEARRPIVCFGEQVASIDGLAWLDLVQTDLDGADYTCGAVDLCAAGVGAPHWRQRLYWVAESDRGRCEISSQSNGESKQTSSDGHSRGRDDDGCGFAGFVADSAIIGDEWRRPSETERRTGEPERFCNAGGMADDFSDGRSTRRRTDGSYERFVSGPVGKDGGVAYADGRNSCTEGLQRSGEHRQRAEDGRNVPMERGPVNGFWRSADWVLTRPQRVGDRLGLRPIERGSFPLAHGASERVGRLRGYGDGIVAQAAQAFIEAYLSTKDAETQ